MGVVVVVVCASMLALVGYRVVLTVRAIRLERAGQGEEAGRLRVRAFQLRIAMVVAGLALAAVILIAALAG